MKDEIDAKLIQLHGVEGCPQLGEKLAGSFFPIYIYKTDSGGWGMKKQRNKKRKRSVHGISILLQQTKSLLHCHHTAGSSHAVCFQ